MEALNTPPTPEHHQHQAASEAHTERQPWTLGENAFFSLFEQVAVYWLILRLSENYLSVFNISSPHKAGVTGKNMFPTF